MTGGLGRHVSGHPAAVLALAGSASARSAVAGTGHLSLVDRRQQRAHRHSNLPHNDLVASTVQFTIVLAFTILVMLLVIGQQ